MWKRITLVTGLLKIWLLPPWNDGQCFDLETAFLTSIASLYFYLQVFLPISWAPFMSPCDTFSFTHCTCNAFWCQIRIFLLFAHWCNHHCLFCLPWEGRCAPHNGTHHRCLSAGEIQSICGHDIPSVQQTPHRTCIPSSCRDNQRVFSLGLPSVDKYEQLLLEQM